jgi:hypothetical protein
VLLLQQELSIVEIVKVQDVVERSANSVSSRVPKYEPAAKAGVTASASAEPRDDKGTLGHACLPACLDYDSVRQCSVGVEKASYSFPTSDGSRQQDGWWLTRSAFCLPDVTHCMLNL